MEHDQSQEFGKLVKANRINGPLMLSFSSDLSLSCDDQLDMHSGVRANQLFLQSPVSMNPSALHSYEHNAYARPGGISPANSNTQLDWDPRAVLCSLSSLDHRLHQVQDVVRSMITKEGWLNIQDTELKAKEQLVTTDLHNILIQVISTAGTLLPLINNNLASNNLLLSAELRKSVSSATLPLNGASPLGGIKPSDNVEAGQHLNGTNEKVPPKCLVEDCNDGVDCDNLHPGSFELLQLEEDEILTLQTHFCRICDKVFKRDANLRMHMRGHGDEYKSPAALAKPSRDPNSEPVPIKRYSCPIVGCKRNKEHKKFLPLKTVLCVKNHYKRSHCDKRYTCSRCNNKKFSMLADLKTHEKHCGSDKWVCSCGTTFSRKDKLFGHVALFQGHAPLPRDESRGTESSLSCAQHGEPVTVSSCSSRPSFGEDNLDVGFPDVQDDDRNLLSTYNFDSCNFGVLHEFPEPGFEVSGDSFPFMPDIISGCALEYGESLNCNQFG